MSGYPIRPDEQGCTAEADGYVCTRMAADRHNFHRDPDGHWWMYYPNSVEELVHPIPKTGYMLLHDSILPRIRSIP